MRQVLLCAALFCASGCNYDETLEARAVTGHQPGDGAEVTWPSDPGHFRISQVSLKTGINDAVPLAAVLTVKSTAETVLDVQVVGGGETWTVSSRPLASQHLLRLIGVKPDTEYALTPILRNASGVVQGTPLAWTTPPLPKDFPPLQVTVAKPGRMEPGMTLFNVRTEPSPHIIVIDEAGNVRWWHRERGSGLGSNDVQLLSNGNLLAGTKSLEIVELDWLGSVVSRWHAADAPDVLDPAPASIPVAVESMHHHVEKMPSGNLLTLSTERRRVDDYPTEADNRHGPRVSTLVAGDVIVEFTPDGEVIKRVSLLDLLEPTRIGYGATAASFVYREPARDWSHANTATYDPVDDAYLISARHQDAIIKVDRKSEQVLWILANHADWPKRLQAKLLEPIGELSWPYHQHSVSITPRGIGLFDNGNYRAPAFFPHEDAYSRAVEFFVDERAMTVTQLWSYGDPPNGSRYFFSRTMSDVDWLPETGNILVSCGHLIDEGPPLTEYVRLFELDPRENIVFEMTIRDRGKNPVGHTTYRAERIADIRFL